MSRPLDHNWRDWLHGTDEMLAELDPQIKKEWGELFGQVPQLQMILQQHGPIAVFDSVNRLIGSDDIEVQVREVKGVKQFRYRLAYLGMGEFATIKH